jgi:hypothetical protein
VIRDLIQRSLLRPQARRQTPIAAAGAPGNCDTPQSRYRNHAWLSRKSCGARRGR